MLAAGSLPSAATPSPGLSIALAIERETPASIVETPEPPSRTPIEMQPLDLQPPELPATEPLPFPDRDLPSPDPLAEARPVPDATWLADLRPRLDAEPKRPAEKVEPPAPEPPSELPSSDARSARLVPLPGRNEPPPYPATAVRLRHQGLVSVQLEVDAQGCVTRAAIKQSSGSALLDLVARKALSLWRFQGGPGAIEWQVEFRLGDRGPSVSSGQPRR